MNLAAFLRDQSGATSIEYGLIAALICMVVIGGMSMFGTELETLFTYIADTIVGEA